MKSTDFLNTLRSTFALNSDGYIFPIKICIKLSPFIEKGFKILSLVIPILTDRNYAIVSKEGEISNVTKGFAEALNITQAYKNNKNKINLSNLSPKMTMLLAAFNDLQYLEDVKPKVTKINK